MTKTITETPREWATTQNIVPSALAVLADTSPFTASHHTLSIENAEVIDGHSLKKVKSVSNW